MCILRYSEKQHSSTLLFLYVLELHPRCGLKETRSSVCPITLKMFLKLFNKTSYMYVKFFVLL